MTKRSTAANGQVQYMNPPNLPQNPAFTNLVTVTGPVRTIYVGGQNAVDTSSAIIGKNDFKAQSEQTLRNVQSALEAGGAQWEHVVKLNIYVVQGQPLQEGFEAFQRIWGNRSHPPAVSVLFVAGLAHPDFLLEIDAIAVVPE